MPEEFKWLNQNMKTRGARQDEAIQVLRLLMPVSYTHLTLPTSDLV